jgi:hypothetical protein
VACFPCGRYGNELARWFSTHDCIVFARADERHDLDDFVAEMVNYAPIAMQTLSGEKKATGSQ